jgi:8-oxo-dGTP pyrophosphatase MutT (NUDIX family)
MSEDSFHLGIKALIRNNEGKVLLLQVNPAKLHGERKNYWDLPGGRVQKGHTVLDTLKREVAEETGIIDIQATKDIGMVLSNIRIPFGEGDTVGLILGVYKCEVAEGSNIVLSDEHVAYDWFAPKEAADLLTVKYPKRFCELVANL